MAVENSELSHAFYGISSGLPTDALPYEVGRNQLIEGLSEIDTRLNALRSAHDDVEHGVTGLWKQTHKYTNLLTSFPRHHAQYSAHRGPVNDFDDRRSLSSVEVPRGAAASFSLPYESHDGVALPHDKSSMAMDGVVAPALSDVMSGPLTHHADATLRSSLLETFNFNDVQRKRLQEARQSLLSKWSSRRIDATPLATSSVKATPQKEASNIILTEKDDNMFTQQQLSTSTHDESQASIRENVVGDLPELKKFLSAKATSSKRLESNSASFDEMEARISRLKNMMRASTGEKMVQTETDVAVHQAEKRRSHSTPSSHKRRRTSIPKVPMPFVAGKSAGPSYSVRANLQQLFAQLRNRDPRLLEAFLSVQDDSRLSYDLVKFETLVSKYVASLRNELEADILRYDQLSEAFKNGKNSENEDKQLEDLASAIEKKDTDLTKLKQMRTRIMSMLRSKPNSNCSVKNSLHVEKAKANHFAAERLRSQSVSVSIARPTEATLLKSRQLSSEKGSRRQVAEKRPATVQTLQDLKSLKTALQ